MPRELVLGVACWVELQWARLNPTSSRLRYETEQRIFAAQVSGSGRFSGRRLPGLVLESHRLGRINSEVICTVKSLQKQGGRKRS
jgi:hypothetical protein